MQTTEEMVDTSQALDVSSVDTKCSRTESKEQDTSSKSGNDAHDDDADIRPIYDEELMAEVQTTPKIDVFTIGQQHTEQPEFNNEVTTHYLSKEREVASAKPYHMIASSNSRISSKNMTRFSSSDMVHNHYLEEAKKKTQERSRNSEPSLMPFARSKSTANGSKPMPRRNTQTSRNWLASKNSFVTTKTVPIAEHPRNSRNDSYVTKFLKGVNSRAKVPSNKTTNRNKPVEQKDQLKGSKLPYDERCKEEGRTTNLRNEISNFQQRFDESFHEAWDRYKDLLRACPHHGLTELHQLDTFYNALNPADQDSLNAAAGGNLLERTNPPPSPVKAVEETCVTCGGAHPYYQCLTTGGNTFPEFKDNIQGYVAAAAVNYNQGNPGYPPSCLANQIRPPAVILKKLPEKLEDLGKFLIPCRFSELKCKALADLDFVIVDYESDPRVLLILGRPFLRTARALIDVHGEEMILHDGDERLTLNMRHDTSSYSNQPQKESINLINVFNNSSEDFLKDLFPYQPSGNPTFLLHPELTSPEINNDIFDLEGCNVLSEKLVDHDSTKDLHPPLHDNPSSGSTTYPLLEESADELPLEYDDNLQFDIESDLKEIEFLLYQDKDFSLNDSIDQKNYANLADIFVDSIPEMFPDEHTLDYSSPLIFDVYVDDFLEVESDAENIYNDPFDSKGEKIKESKLLIDELDLPCDFHPPSEYDSFFSQDFYRVDALPSTNNEDKIFNPVILIQD
nr:reverse transcriptase domain-containing protein [Tanacetum cinerariifolium]